MLPLSLRVVWFCLSLSGTLSSWAVMLSFTRAVGSYWSLMYCVGCTVTHLAFCLGMVYKMDPLSMTYGFCVSQHLLLNFGYFIMTGASAAFAIATRYVALKPKAWVEGEKGVMVWRRIYHLPLFIFPLLASTVQVPLSLQFDSGMRHDDLRCDYSDPTWIRLISYAGIPWILTVPCLVISINAILRIRQTQQHLKRSKDSSVGSVLPQRLNHGHITHASNSGATLDPRLDTSFQPGVLNLDSAHPSMYSSPGLYKSDSSFPTFANLPVAGAVSMNDGMTFKSASPQKESWRELLNAPSFPDLDGDSLRRIEGSDSHSDYGYGKGEDDFMEEDSHSDPYMMQVSPRSAGAISRRSRRPLPTLAPTVYRIIVFQLVFTIIQLLSSITPLIDVGRHRLPVPFGTQHVALVLSAWAPVFVFFPSLDLWSQSFRFPWK